MSDLEPPKKGDKDPYTLGRILHKGKHTIVQEACDFGGNPVVIKKIRYKRSTRAEEVRNEVSLMFKYKHPNLVNYYTSFIHEKDVWIVMERYDCSLTKLIKPDGVKDIPFIATIFHQVLTCLEYLHENNVIHRDIKGGNILINRNGLACLGDLGVSKVKNDDDEVQSVVGTPCWMSPEMLEGEYDAKTDVWSFGITLLEAWNGSPPYSNYAPLKALLFISSEEPPLPTKNEISHSGLRTVMELCLDKDSEKRTTSKKLLEHKFWKNKKEPNYITPFVDSYLEANGLKPVIV